jgi:protein transport protein SEC13
VWKEASEGVWQAAYATPPGVHSASVNSCAWAPHELGLVLAAASSDGSLSVLSAAADGSWSISKIERAHLMGATAVSWAPPTPPGSLVSTGSGTPLVRRLVSCGCDNLVKVWECRAGGWGDAPEAVLRGHTDWVRDVAWAPNLGMPRNTIASCGQDGRVLVWTQGEPGGPWAHALLADLKGPVWRVSWSVFGNVLAVADGTAAVTLWKEGPGDGQWAQLADANTLAA